MSELDVLHSLGAELSPPPFEALRETAHRRDRAARVMGGVALVLSVTAASATAAYVTRDGDRDVQPAPAPAPTTRPLTYADGSTISYGDQVVEADGSVVELDLTDDGVAFRTDDGRIWFTDGSEVAPLGQLGDTGPGYEDPWPMMSRPGWMLSANDGSRLVWFEFPEPGSPEVVVYDTSSMSEVARDPVRLGPGRTSVPDLVSERFVYLFTDPDPDRTAPDQTLVRYDPVTGEQVGVGEAEVLQDLDADAAVRSVRLKGDDRSEKLRGFHYSDGMGLQMGLDLQPDVAGATGVAPVGPGDMVAEGVDGRPFAFEPPPDGRARSGVAWLVQWLDDQTVVVVNPLRRGTDLLACHLDTASCEVAVSAPAGIVVPDFGEAGFIG